MVRLIVKYLVRENSRGVKIRGYVI